SREPRSVGIPARARARGGGAGGAPPVGTPSGLLRVLLLRRKLRLSSSRTAPSSTAAAGADEALPLVGTAVGHRASPGAAAGSGCERGLPPGERPPHRGATGHHVERGTRHREGPEPGQAWRPRCAALPA